MKLVRETSKLLSERAIARIIALSTTVEARPMNNQLSLGRGNTQTTNITNFNGCEVSVQNITEKDNHQPLDKSIVFDLLKLAMALDMPTSDEYPLDPPADFYIKLDYNNAPKYKSIFPIYHDDYARIEEVMKEFFDTQALIKKLQRQFIDEAYKRGDTPENITDGDIILDSIISELCTLVKNDSSYDPEIIKSEHIEQFCTGLVQYGIMRCKILVNPNSNAIA